MIMTIAVQQTFFYLAEILLKAEGFLSELYKFFIFTKLSNKYLIYIRIIS